MSSSQLMTQEFDFEFPPELIAQEPAEERVDSRLLVLDRSTCRIVHDRFCNIGHYLARTDVLVLNRTKVIPARLFARRPTGGRVEILLSRQVDDNSWIALARPSRRLEVGDLLQLEGTGVAVALESREESGMWRARFTGEGDVSNTVRAAASIALPPYIQNESAPLDRYQTVYADQEGSIAAPTAGLHFSNELLRDLESEGIETILVTLHVGPGTFIPVKVDRVDDHQMLSEWGEVTPEAANRVNKAKSSGGRVVAVGTTTTRLLESAFDQARVAEFRGEATTFIRPGYEFRVIDALVTNFHLPRSTLLMLVAAFAGRELIFEAYAEAIRHGYRFYSFGDAMLIT